MACLPCGQRSAQKRAPTYLLQRNMMRFIMIEGIQLERGHDSTSRQIGGWRAVLAAWALVLVFALLVAGAKAMTCRTGVAHPDRHLAGAVIPQHDPCIEPGVPSAPGVDGCRASPLNQERWAYW
jgi:hypothetical protein